MGPPSGVELARRRFTEADQRWFTDLSGDRNPLHVDPVLARRLLTGQVVVHGMHVVLWMLEVLVSQQHEAVGHVTASFLKPVFLDEELVLKSHASGSYVILRIERHGTPLLELRITVAEAAPIPAPTNPAPDDSHESRPLERDLAEIQGLSGRRSVAYGGDRLSRVFPTAARRLGVPVLAELTAVSALVGMECPGLHSVLGGLDLAVGPHRHADGIQWQVRRTDPRVGGVLIEIDGATVRGRVQAFVRPPPVSQPSIKELAKHVSSGEFGGVRALVVGGSRGLGELTAKLLAVGGARVAITWHRGRGEADRVAEEIRAAGGDAVSRQLDVDAPGEAISDLARGSLRPTHLFYFASPRIFARRTRWFDEGLLDSFIRAYVTGFVRTVDACLATGSDDLVAFYPSSVAITEDRADLIEYAAAKASGEVTARSLAAAHERLRVIVERLPRLPTDQTATLLDVATSDPVEVMTGNLRRVVTSP